MANDTLSLLPNPQHLVDLGGPATLLDNRLIILDSPDPHRLRFTAGQLQQALQQHAKVNWQIVAGNTAPSEQVGLTLSLVSHGIRHLQGYELTITPKSILIAAGTPSGIFYAVQTLSQILQQRQRELPSLRINDWPDFPQRGVMLDISRDKVPTMEILFNLVDMLAAWKINQLQLYTEHTFAYQNHPEVWADASPMTGEEILTLDAYCRERFIELVPNQNTFGHMRRWLVHERYNHLAECPHGCDTGDPEWGYFDEPFTLCPEDPTSLDFIRGLMDELLPHFSSRQFNVGCDEAVELGCGRSQEAVTQRGKGRVYLDFLLKLYREVKGQGYTMQFWDDIIMAYPELVAELPRDLIALEWGYEANHPFDKHAAKLAAVDIPFYVCPGTSSWNTITGRTDNALKNLRNAAKNGLEHGAVGYLIADWGDNGHWQPLPVSYLGYSYGAALAWAYQANHAQDMAQALNRHAFRDPTGLLGRLAYDLGNAYLQMELPLPNNSILFRILQKSPAEILAWKGLTEAKLQKTLAYINQATSNLADAQPNLPDADLLRREFSWAADMLRHACRRGMWVIRKRPGKGDTSLRQQLAEEADRLIAEYREIWLARNRVGGLKDSLGRMEKMRRDYV